MLWKQLNGNNEYLIVFFFLFLKKILNIYVFVLSGFCLSVYVCVGCYHFAPKWYNLDKSVFTDRFAFTETWSIIWIC